MSSKVIWLGFCQDFAHRLSPRYDPPHDLCVSKNLRTLCFYHLRDLCQHSRQSCPENHHKYIKIAFSLAQSPSFKLPTHSTTSVPNSLVNIWISTFPTYTHHQFNLSIYVCCKEHHTGALLLFWWERMIKLILDSFSSPINCPNYYGVVVRQGVSRINRCAAAHNMPSRLGVLGWVPIDWVIQLGVIMERQTN